MAASPDHTGNPAGNDAWVPSDMEELIQEQQLEEQLLRELAGVQDLREATYLEIEVDTSTASVNSIAQRMPNLRELKLNGSVLESIRDLGSGLKNLQVLWVARCGLSGLEGIGGVPLLRELYASFNHIDNLEPLTGLEHLETLDLEGNALEDIGNLAYLAWCPNLSMITLAGNPVAEDNEYIQQVAAALPQLQTVDDVELRPSTSSRPLSSRQPSPRHGAPPASTSVSPAASSGHCAVAAGGLQAALPAQPNTQPLPASTMQPSQQSSSRPPSGLRTVDEAAGHGASSTRSAPGGALENMVPGHMQLAPGMLARPGSARMRAPGGVGMRPDTAWGGRPATAFASRPQSADSRPSTAGSLPASNAAPTAAVSGLFWRKNHVKEQAPPAIMILDLERRLQTGSADVDGSDSGSEMSGVEDSDHSTPSMHSGRSTLATTRGVLLDMGLVMLPELVLSESVQQALQRHNPAADTGRPAEVLQLDAPEEVAAEDTGADTGRSGYTHATGSSSSSAASTARSDTSGARLGAMAHATMHVRSSSNDESGGRHSLADQPLEGVDPTVPASSRPTSSDMSRGQEPSIGPGSGDGQLVGSTRASSIGILEPPLTAQPRISGTGSEDSMDAMQPGSRSSLRMVGPVEAGSVMGRKERRLWRRSSSSGSDCRDSMEGAPGSAGPSRRQPQGWLGKLQQWGQGKREQRRARSEQPKAAPPPPPTLATASPYLSGAPPRPAPASSAARTGSNSDSNRAFPVSAAAAAPVLPLYPAMDRAPAQLVSVSPPATPPFYPAMDRAAAQLAPGSPRATPPFYPTMDRASPSPRMQRLLSSGIANTAATLTSTSSWSATGVAVRPLSPSPHPRSPLLSGRPPTPALGTVTLPPLLTATPGSPNTRPLTPSSVARPMSPSQQQMPYTGGSLARQFSLQSQPSDAGELPRQLSLQSQGSGHGRGLAGLIARPASPAGRPRSASISGLPSPPASAMFHSRSPSSGSISGSDRPSSPVLSVVAAGKVHGSAAESPPFSLSAAAGLSRQVELRNGRAEILDLDGSR